MLPDDQPTLPTARPNGSRPAPQSGMWQAPSVEEMQTMLPQYEIIEILGRGGMGAVYKGRQKSLKRLVAIKILPLGMADDEMKFVERFQNEAQTMAAMNHPAIVSVYDFGETADGLLYFIMEFVDGTDVHKMIQASGRLSGEYALAITAHVCDALDYAHKRGVIHRDIKPANILIDQEGHIKVADFGLAKMSDPSQTSGLTKTNMAMGTPDYVAPEVLVTGMVADHRADIYAVGVMLYQMLTGEVPRGMFKLPSQKGIGCDPRFDEIIHRAMEQDREERYQSAMDVRRALDVIRTTPQPKDDGTGVVPVKEIRQKPVAKGPRPPGERSQPPAQKPAPQQAPAQKAAAAPKAKAPPKKQSPATMWLSIGGIVAVLGVAGFLVFGAKSKPQPDSAAAADVSAPQPERKPAAPIKVRDNAATPIASAPAVRKTSDILAPVIFGGHRYQLIAKEGKPVWDECKARAEAMGGHLVTITSDEEQNFVLQTFGPYLRSASSEQLWLGAMCLGRGKPWQWVTGEPFGKTYWRTDYTGEPPDNLPHWMSLLARSSGELAWNGVAAREFTDVRPPNVRGFMVEWDDKEIASTPAKGGTIDLLSLVDLTRDEFEGNWTRTAEGIAKQGSASISGNAPRVRLPYEPPQEYDIEFEFTAGKGTQSLGLFLSAESRYFSWILGGGKGDAAGFELFDTKPTSVPNELSTKLEEPIEAGRRYRSRVEVRAGTLRGYLDDKKLIDWDGRGKFTRLGTSVEVFKKDMHLGLRAARDVVFHHLTVREVSGAGKMDAGVNSLAASEVTAAPNGKTVDWLKTPPWNTPWLLKGGVLSTTNNGVIRALGTMTDGAVRVRVRSTPATRLPGPARPTLQVDLRNGPVAGARNKKAQFLMQTYSDKRVCSLVYIETDVSTGIRSQPEALWSSKSVPSASATKDEIEWEFRAVGDELSAWADGVLIASVRDARVPSGSCTVLAETGIEIIRLETTGVATAASTSLTPPTTLTRTVKNENWTDRLGTMTWAAPWSMKDGALAATTSLAIQQFDNMTDGSIRIRARVAEGATAALLKNPVLQPALRSQIVRPGWRGSYLFQAYMPGRACTLVYMEREDKKVAAEMPPVYLWKEKPLPPELIGKNEIEWECRAIGDELSMWADGKLVASVHDSRLTSGGSKLQAYPGFEITRLETSGITPNAGTISPQAAGNIAVSEALWRPIFHKPADFDGDLRDVEFRDGATFIKARTFRAPADPAIVGIRSTLRYLEGDRTGSLTIRSTEPAPYGEEDFGLTAFIAPKGATLVVKMRDRPAGISQLGRHDFPLSPALKEGELFTFELRAEGKKITAIINGREVGSVTDAWTGAPRRFGITPSNTEMTEFRDVAVQLKQGE